MPRWIDWFTYVESGLNLHLKAYLGWASICCFGLSFVGSSGFPLFKDHTKQCPLLFTAAIKVPSGSIAMSWIEASASGI